MNKDFPNHKCIICSVLCNQIYKFAGAYGTLKIQIDFRNLYYSNEKPFDNNY